MTAAPLERPPDGRADGAGGDVLTVADLTGLGPRHRPRRRRRFDDRPGERVGLIGESGSGKSLTALAVMGLLPEDVRTTGSVAPGRSAEHDLRRRRRAARCRGCADRDGHGVPGADDGAQPDACGSATRSPRCMLHPPDPAATGRSARAAAVELLAAVGLPDPGDAARAYPHQLSGGQRQRVVLAIALANDPALLICDEPTTALDVTVQAQVLDLIVAGVATRDSALLFITHDLAVVATVCSRVLVMYGRPNRGDRPGRGGVRTGRGIRTPAPSSTPPTSPDPRPGQCGRGTALSSPTGQSTGVAGRGLRCCPVAGLSPHLPPGSYVRDSRHAAVGARPAGREFRHRRRASGSASSGSPAPASPRSYACWPGWTSRARARSLRRAAGSTASPNAGCGSCGRACSWSSRTRWARSTPGCGSATSSPSRWSRCAAGPAYAPPPGPRAARRRSACPPTPPTATRTSSPAGSGSASPSPGRSRPPRSSWSPTSRSAPWTSRSAARCSTCSRRWRLARAHAGLRLARPFGGTPDLRHRGRPARGRAGRAGPGRAGPHPARAPLHTTIAGGGAQPVAGTGRSYGGRVRRRAAGASRTVGVSSAADSAEESAAPSRRRSHSTR